MQKKPREVQAETLHEAVKGLFMKANTSIGQDVYNALVHARYRTEDSPVGQSVMDQIIKNHDIARETGLPICQDTGMAVVFVDLGQEVRITGGAFEDIINGAVAEAWEEGYFRRSLLDDPLFDRKNTGDNTPAVIHLRMVPGDRVAIAVTAKGFGSENMSALRMCTPAEGPGGVRKFVVETVVKAGPNPCPPTIIGVGVGGTMELAALNAKRATMIPVGLRHPDARYARLEEDILSDINASGIGPAGLGGRTTCLDVHIRHAPAHLAGIAVAVNVCCHAARHAAMTI
ncbi:MAG: fumarate hydratase [Synergistota bacterium]|nr:fumarate hydratase [Synergistota bacterium]